MQITHLLLSVKMIINITKMVTDHVGMCSLLVLQKNPAKCITGK